MELINKKLSEIKLYEKNPRRNDEAVKYVAESIKEFGFKVPIVIDKHNVIVAGHTRWKAAKSLNIDEVPCIVADDLTDEQIKAYRLADNKVAEFAEWDFNMLNLELDDLLDFDMSSLGFDIDEVVDEFGTEFDLPDGDKSELEQITFTLHHEQAELIRYSIGQIDECPETFGNTNKNGNAIYELVKQWAELKK